MSTKHGYRIEVSRQALLSFSRMTNSKCITAQVTGEKKRMIFEDDEDSDDKEDRNDDFDKANDFKEGEQKIADTADWTYCSDKKTGFVLSELAIF